MFSHHSSSKLTPFQEAALLLRICPVMLSRHLFEILDEPLSYPMGEDPPEVTDAERRIIVRRFLRRCGQDPVKLANLDLFIEEHWKTAANVLAHRYLKATLKERWAPAPLHTGTLSPAQVFAVILMELPQSLSLHLLGRLPVTMVCRITASIASLPQLTPQCRERAVRQFLTDCGREESGPQGLAKVVTIHMHLCLKVAQAHYLI